MSAASSKPAPWLQKYLRDIFATIQRGDAREESHYSSLERLLKGFAESTGKSNFQITTLPKKTEAGNPDFRVWDGRQHIVGYIEAKKPTESLDRSEASEQLRRYRNTFPNLILTNLFEFRLYRDGDRIGAVQIGRPFVAYQLKTVPPLEREGDFLDLLEKFSSFSLPRTYSANSLAVELAKRTRFLKEEVVAAELRNAAGGSSSFLLGFYEAFQKYLMGSLTKEQFADLYAQTITYGLFAARTRSTNGFSRRQAFENIPPTIGILRDIFRFISLEDLPPQMEWIVDDIAEVLAVADTRTILQQRPGQDPIVRFYEPFLAEYDPVERERRGVYYTPEPVVSYIVRSLHAILKDVFHREDGFASTSVRVLDPASGTCTFPAEATRTAIAEFTEKYGGGARKGFIRDQILKNFFAFELMMAPYAVGHLKIGLLLDELGYRVSKDDRFQLYLTNALDFEELEATKFPGMASLADESHLAGRVKKETPILVILGNPPYSGHSANRSWKVISQKRGSRILTKRVPTFIGELIEDYKQVDGKPLGERNSKWLQDDYVKFIRFAQWKIEQAGEGVLGFITNHSYLDNPTFRGMRRSLMRTFQQIYLLDLHGNSLKKEKAPQGIEDKNVFDIRQGVAIGLFIKCAGLRPGIFHGERWGSRPAKYDWLESNSSQTTEWTRIEPHEPRYLFVSEGNRATAAYGSYASLPDIFAVSSVGIVTSRDSFAIDFERATLERRIAMFRDPNQPDELLREAFALKDKAGWKMADRRKAVMADPNWQGKVTRVLYRPFDVRWIFYSKDVLERPRPEVMRHMLAGEDLALITPRQHKDEFGALVTDVIGAHKSVAAYDINYLFPLYLYEKSERKDLFEAKMPNLKADLLKGLERAYGEPPTPEQVFHYVYAVLYAPGYRTKYAEWLRSDFPRVPFTADQELFAELARLGQRLAELHLLTSPELDPPLARLEGAGDGKVENSAYAEGEQRVYISQGQYFQGLDPRAWQYRVGGYQVLSKWLKDRKGRSLSLEDVRHYCRVVTAISKTLALQEQIDSAYRGVEESVVGSK